MKIKRVFDILGPDGFVPNAWNYNYTLDLWNHNFQTNHGFINDFNEKYGQISVFDCHLNILEDDLDDIHITKLKYLPEENKVLYKNKEHKFFYTIHPFGDIKTCIGKNLNYHQGKHCFDFISNLTKKYLKDTTNFYLLFDYSSEGDIKKDLFESIHTQCKKHNIPADKVIILTSAINTRDIYQEYLNEYPQKTQFYTAYYMWSLINKRGETDHLLFNQDEQYEFNGNKNNPTLMNKTECLQSTNRNKKCLILNRRVAPHRVILLSLLKNDDLLNDVDYSIDLSLHWDVKQLGLDISNGTGYNGMPYLNNSEIKKQCMNGFFKLEKDGKHVVDYPDIDGVWGFGFEHKENYLNTYFSVITETLFYEHGHYISEKTFKGIQHLHPFIIVGKPGILKYLKKLGFQTFSDFWDESYDSIDDDSDRMVAIYKLVKSLILKSNEEWDLLTKQILPILTHNRNILLTYENKRINDLYITNLNKLIENEPNQENYSLL